MIALPLLWMSVAAAAPAASSASAEAAPSAHVVIVATNTAVGEPLAPLRYADDDGARYYELFRLLGAEHVHLLSVMDADTQRRFPEVAAQAHPPTRAELRQVLSREFAAIAAERAAGQRTAFYFVYVGHGALGESGEGSMFLADGRFTRSDLFQEVVSKSPADVGHLIIDACHAFMMVARRGGTADRAAIDRAVANFVSKESLDRYPNFGVIASTSGAAEVHEWERYQAGVFSHEVRSGLTGAADVDGDGAVSYDELRAFVAAANAKVTDPAARVAAHIAPPPVNLATPVLARRWAPDAPTLHVPPKVAGRWYLEDARGVRYADFHSAADGALTLMLVPSPRYYLRNGREEVKIDLLLSARADASAASAQPMSVASRGSEAETFQRDLFAVPFGRAYLDGFLAIPQPVQEVSLIAPPASGLSAPRIAALATGGAALAALGVGIGLGAHADALAADYRARIGEGPEVSALADDSDRAATAANVLMGVGAGAAAVALGLWLWGGE